MSDLVVKNVDLFGDLVVAAQDKDGAIWAGISWICNGIGLNKDQTGYERKKIQGDLVLSQGVKFYPLGTDNANSDVLCLQLDYVPLWLAKISITPNMKENSPELVEKLVKYQLQAKDVLARAFLRQKEERKESLDAVNRAADILKGVYQAAGTDERYLALLVGSVYKECGMEFSLPPVKTDVDKLYDQTMIAGELGVMSVSGKPHSQAVGAIIDMMDVSDDDKINTPYARNGHSGVSVQYTRKVLSMVREWIEGNEYPTTIKGNGKNFKVSYVR